MTLTEKIDDLADRSKWDFSDLRALFINGTLEKSPEVSNTQGLAEISIAIMEKNGVAVDVIRAVDHEIATPAHGNQRSEWDAGCRFDFPNPDYR